LPDGYLYAYKVVEMVTGGYTNRIDTSDSNFQKKYRVNANNEVTTANVAEAFVSNYITATAQDVIRIKGVMDGEGTSGTRPRLKILAYAGTTLKEGFRFETGTATNQILSRVEISDDGTYTWTIGHTTNADHDYDGRGITSVRVAGVATNGFDNVIVTINEEIAESSVVSGYQWANTDRAFVPADNEDDIAELKGKTTQHGVKLLEIEEQLENIKVGSAEEVRWFALGDSITEGYASALNDDGTYRQYITSAENRWVNILAAKNGYTLTNHGIGGSGYLANKSGAILNARQLADTLDFSQCDIVTLAYGVNDWKYAVNIGSMTDDITTGGSMVANMRYVIKKILTDNPLCKIFVITPINCKSYGTYDTNWGIGYKGGTTGALNSLGLQDIFDRLKEVCEYHGIEMIDMTHSSIVNRENIEAVLADNVHPTEECHKAMARELAKKINFA
jgi:lysophospholipase L1-like esterase